MHLRPDWALHLGRFGARPALLTGADTAISYAELVARADAFAARLGPVPRLVALGVRNDVDSIAAYLGCLRGGHPVLLLAAGGLEPRILDSFRPDAVRDAATGTLTLAPEPLGGLHPDLAVLLSTSGSTGSPKLVRLAATAIAANAAAICSYLEIGAAERAITSLPFHYSYGLSVLNSHLMAGASLVLTDLSVTHPEFEALLQQARPTSIAGVPYTHELLLRSGLMQRLPDSIRTVTQAGGRLAPELILEIAALSIERAFRFFPMYGQTEATARMAYLPPELVETHPDCIGNAIPGGEFTLVDDAGQPIARAGVAGELVYRGANVMMGYGLARADLARGPELDCLHTGDIAERTADGLYRIVGRASRFAKIAGLRIGFDDVEALLRARAIESVATGSDDLVVVQVADAAQRQAAAAAIAAGVHIPESAIAVIAGEVPRLANGKVDYGAIRQAGMAEMAARSARLDAGIHPILAGFRRAFNAPDLPANESFQSFGGDSLAYVNVAIAIEKSLGELPPHWEEMPVAALIAMDDGSRAPTSRGGTRIGTETLVGMFALLLVIIGHGAPDETVDLRGGAAVLMLLAGYNFAHFQRSAFERGHWWPALRGALERLILPYYLMMIPMLLWSKAEKSWGWFALVSTYTVDNRGPLFAFWFIETVFHCLLLMILLYAVPGVRRLSQARPVLAGCALVGFALVLKITINRYVFDDFNPISLTVDAQFWLYALGFLALSLRARWAKLLLVAVAFAVAFVDYGDLSPRPWWLALAAGLVLFWPVVRVPARLAGPLLRIAAASYFIYIIHVPLHHVVRFMLGLTDRPALASLLLVLLSGAGGVLFDAIWSRAMLAVKARLARARRQPQPAG